MKINFSSLNFNNSLLKPQDAKVQPSFGSVKAQRFLERVKTAKSFQHFNATFEDMVSAYNELGYDVLCKRGSHAVVPVTEKVNLPLVIPHGTKYVNPQDLKRLQFVLNGQIDRALAVH